MMLGVSAWAATSAQSLFNFAPPPNLATALALPAQDWPQDRTFRRGSFTIQITTGQMAKHSVLLLQLPGI
jgi:hypothetical protein